MRKILSGINPFHSVHIESTFDEVEVDGLGKGHISILKAVRLCIRFRIRKPATLNQIIAMRNQGGAAISQQ